MTGPFKACIEDAAKAGEIAKEVAAEAHETYDAAYEAAADLGPVEADRTAARATLDALEREALRRERLKALSVRTLRTALDNAAAFMRTRGHEKVRVPGGGGGKPPKAGWTISGEPPPSGPYASGGIMADWMKELVDGSGGLAGAQGASIKGRYQALAGSFQAMMADLAEKFDSATGLPIRGRATLSNVVREAFGEDSGDAAAKALAHTWGETAEYARTLFNAAGGDVGKVEKWGLPQSWDPIAVRGAGKEGWIDAVLPRLDRARMIDRVANQPFTDRRLRAVLGDVHETIVTRGAIDRDVGEALGTGMMANRRADHRFLIFKSADDWLAANRDFSRVDPYATMQHHLDGLARDIAQMQILGPNPAHQFEWLAKAAERQAAIEQGLGAAPQNLIKHARGDIDSARKMLGVFTGDLASPYGPDNVIARVGTATRAWLSGAMLGRAIINDFTANSWFAAQVKAHAGLSALPDFREWSKHVLSPEARKVARRTGFILESTRARHAADVRRFLQAQTVGSKMTEGVNAVAKLLPTWINRAAFLEPNLRASRQGFQMEFMGHLYDKRDLTIAALAGSRDKEERAFAQLLTARGFSEADWKAVAKGVETAAPGAHFISPQALHAAGESELGWRVAEMIERETRSAVPEPSLWAQAQMTANNRPGTIMGEIVRSAMSYRSFSVTQSYGWSREFALRGFLGVEARGLPWQVLAAAAAAPIIIEVTIAGALSMWLRDMDKGLDPRPAWSDDPKEAPKVAAQFWTAALATGGGSGILGDFVYSVQARNGKSMAATAFGPAMGLAADTYDLTVGNAAEALAGKETHIGREAVTWARRYNPVASLWWTSTAMNRAVLDQMQKLIDPKADEAFKRSAQRMQREQHQEAWWPQGSVLPTRAPNFGNAIGHSADPKD